MHMLPSLHPKIGRRERTSKKIPDACKREGVKSRSIMDLIAAEFTNMHARVSVCMGG